MKHARRWINLTLAFLLLVSGAASATTVITPASAETERAVVTSAPAGTFRGGVTWDSTVDDVLLAENAQGGVLCDIYNGNGYRNYLFEIGADESPAEIGYGFIGDLLIFFVSDVGSDSTHSFGAKEAEFIAVYGEPTETDAAHAVALLNTLGEDSMEEEDITEISGWSCGDGTMAYLFLMYGDLYSILLNEPRILCPRAGEAAAETEAVFVFVNGLAWSATTGDMLAAEEARGEGDYAETACGDYMLYTFKDRRVGGENAETAYFYRGDQLAIAAVCFSAAGAATRYMVEDELRDEYGSPAEKDWGKLAVMLEFLFESQDEEHTMSDLVNWSLADGTWISLFTMDDEDLYVFFFNEPAVMDANGVAAEITPYNGFDNAILPEETAPEPETAFTFYSGVGWNSTIAQALSAEGVEDDAGYDRYVQDAYEFLEFDDRPIGDETAEVSYVYQNSRPIAMALTYDSRLLTTFTDRRAELCALYGDPTETNADHVFMLYEALGSAFDREDFQIVFGWALADGTKAYLLVIEDTIYNIYLHEDRILTGAE